MSTDEHDDAADAEAYRFLQARELIEEAGLAGLADLSEDPAPKRTFRIIEPSGGLHAALRRHNSTED